MYVDTDPFSCAGIQGIQGDTGPTGAVGPGTSMIYKSRSILAHLATLNSLADQAVMLHLAKP